MIIFDLISCNFDVILSMDAFTFFSLAASFQCDCDLDTDGRCFLCFGAVSSTALLSCDAFDCCWCCRFFWRFWSTLLKLSLVTSSPVRCNYKQISIQIEKYSEKHGTDVYNTNINKSRGEYGCVWCERVIRYFIFITNKPATRKRHFSCSSFVFSILKFPS